ncbi:hypothetical protein BOX15_Mlig017513g1 [Macrostomum lignano]|uniref:Frizzled-5 n=1 Tax=Macrostomum lignano TaxID=282301 RepID=A0A267DFJ2_9PLAT|nr:hypothetical protein BOX15_Mlig017513g1 [Macrostomum lignano]
MWMRNIAAVGLLLLLSGSRASLGQSGPGSIGGVGRHLSGGPDLSVSAPKKCQLISVPMCRNIGYNYTSMPNQYGDDTQEEAASEVHQFWPLVEISCSQDLRFFLCSMYVPICMHNYDRHLPACRSVCLRAKKGCAPLMRQYGFSWPEKMDCSKLPDYGDPDTLCMDVNHTSTSQPVTTLPPDTDTSYGSAPASCECRCQAPLVQLTENEAHYNKVYTAGLPNCAMPCEGLFFSEKDRDRQFASVWIGMWSILCAVSSTVTVLTFLINSKRFNYPERPIVMLSACYVMVSAGYIVRLAVGPQTIACDGRVLRYGSSGPWLCTVVFLLTYLFGMASCVWWVMLCVAWFLAAGLKWGSEAIAKYSEVFHCIAWVLPIVKFILVLTFSLVDGDPISGICSVGNTNLTAMRLFVLLPLVTYLLIGSVFLLTGFVALFRIRSVIKQQASAKTYKLEKLMIRIGIFSILYTLPASVVIACHFYESQMRERWLQDKACRCPGEKPAAEPEYGVFMLRQFMQLAVGITSGVWVWSGKTLHTWRQFLGRLFCCTGRGGGGGGGGGGGAYSRPSAGGHHFVLGGGAAAQAQAAASAAAVSLTGDPRSHYKFSQAPGQPPLPLLPQSAGNQMSHV